MSKEIHLSPGTAQFLKEVDKAGGPPLYTLSYKDARAVLAGAQSQPTPRPDVDVTDIAVPFKPTGTVDLRILRPKGATEILPVILYLHGGGWVMGDKNTHDRLIREITAGTGAAVAFVNYTPSPEAQYPVPLQQIYACLKYIVKNAEKLKLDAGKIAVAGDSVGGNMAAALTLICKKAEGPKLCFQMLIYPVTDAAFDTPSYKEFADGPWLTRKAMKYFWDAYAPGRKARSEITASPLRAKKKELKDLPPAFVITDANDVLRDEGEAYAAKLDEAGVPVTHVRYSGTIHDFLMLDGLADTPPARSALAQVCRVLALALQ